MLAASGDISSSPRSTPTKGCMGGGGATAMGDAGGVPIGDIAGGGGAGGGTADASRAAPLRGARVASSTVSNPQKSFFPVSCTL
jgi:hypothetical protein